MRGGHCSPRGSGQAWGGSSCSRTGPLWPAWVPDLRCVCGAPHDLLRGNWPPPCSREADGSWIWCFEVKLPVLLGRVFGLWVKRAADMVVSVVPSPFQPCCSASWLCTSVSRTLLPQQVSSAPQGKPAAALGSGTKAVWCNGDSILWDGAARRNLFFQGFNPRKACSSHAAWLEGGGRSYRNMSVVLLQ